MTITSRSVALLALAALLLPSCATNQLGRKGAAQIRHDSQIALQQLYSTNPAAKVLGERSRGVLVFPNVLKGGLILGGQAGDGTLFLRDGREGFYNTVAASYGLQAGVQKFGYAMIFLDDLALQHLQRTDGWEIGSDPNLVVVDRGAATSLSTTTADRGTYVFFFNQRGLMAGLSLQGTKITRIYPTR